MRRAYPQELHCRRSLIESLFCYEKLKLSAGAPGRSPRTQMCQAPLLGLCFNVYRLKHRCLFLEDVNRARWLLVNQRNSVGIAAWNGASGYERAQHWVEARPDEIHRFTAQFGIWGID